MLTIARDQVLLGVAFGTRGGNPCWWKCAIIIPAWVIVRLNSGWVAFLIRSTRIQELALNVHMLQDAHHTVRRPANVFVRTLVLQPAQGIKE